MSLSPIGHVQTRSLIRAFFQALVKKEKVIDTGLKATDQEQLAFQAHKQAKLNELDVVISLKMHQAQMSIHMSIHMSTHMSIHMSIHMSTHMSNHDW